MKSRNLLADLLVEVMKNNELSQRDMAVKLGVSQKALQNWLSQEGIPRLRTSSIIKLSNALNIDIKTIAALISPDNTYDISAKSLLKAQQIDKLPPDIVESIDALIMLGLKKLENAVNDPGS